MDAGIIPFEHVNFSREDFLKVGVDLTRILQRVAVAPNGRLNHLLIFLILLLRGCNYTVH
jgi:hypothetical protein